MDEAEAAEPLMKRLDSSWRSGVWSGPLGVGAITGMVLNNYVIDDPGQARIVSIIAFVVITIGGVLLLSRD
jgi:hypothetical protein